MGGEVHQFRAAVRGKAQGRDVEVFHLGIAPVQLRLQARYAAGGAQAVPQEEGHHLEIMGAGIGEGAVQHLPAMDGHLARPVVAGIVALPAVAVVDAQALGRAVAPGQDVLLQGQHVPAVIQLIPQGQEPPRRLGRRGHVLRLPGGEAQGLFAQHMGAVSQAVQGHVPVKMHRGHQYRQVRAFPGIKIRKLPVYGNVPFL